MEQGADGKRLLRWLVTQCDTELDDPMYKMIQQLITHGAKAALTKVTLVAFAGFALVYFDSTTDFSALCNEDAIAVVLLRLIAACFAGWTRKTNRSVKLLTICLREFHRQICEFLAR